MEKSKDYYRILGVPRDASAAAIRSAYRRLTRARRPGTRQEAGGEAFRDLQQAYEVLSDAERRRHYDEALRACELDRFSALTGSLRPPARAVRSARPITLTGDILLTPAEARSGGSLTLDLAVPGACPACRREAGWAGPSAVCARCRGEGRIERREPLALRIPAGVRAGTVFNVRLDEPEVQAVFLTVHITAPR